MSNATQHSPVEAVSSTPSALGGLQQIAPGVLRLRLPLSNVFLLGDPGGPWVLVDAGTPGSAGMIRRAAEQHFGRESAPQAIVLTHGHLDHIGALHALLRCWPGVKVYAHALEQPYLTGQSAYPPPDPTVGGSMSALSPLFLPGPFDFQPHIHALPWPSDVAALDGWEVVNTPGHAPGHISLWRRADRTLIVGDAFVTTVQESLPAALTLRPHRVHRPPAYYTPDWEAARVSVERLAALHPQIAVTGHGDPLKGPVLTQELEQLAAQFDQKARPAQGRYVSRPAVTSRDGVLILPPLTARGQAVKWTGIGLVLLVLTGLMWRLRSDGGTTEP
ncbi:MBL fold metallo-hydrolase (plasmid) [Deinococcus sp. KNUC1210]|uniref:MBL fold metallo-hydrolase n=1 Tax=Deinococcus sp. KNUC1210 TaxID=2917691 RepID=UPI001EF11278|nr:MBL fold metallo-hydrolase [Deinococcus sp. KNUC1210]ULH17606.1 MBL fold metallo-hydrolase [Deinococcus sp. KNUC1210]